MGYSALRMRRTVEWQHDAREGLAGRAPWRRSVEPALTEHEHGDASVSHQPIARAAEERAPEAGAPSSRRHEERGRLPLAESNERIDDGRIQHGNLDSSRDQRLIRGRERL